MIQTNKIICEYLEKNHPHEDGIWRWHAPTGDKIPNFFDQDLNVMHEAEKVLTDQQRSLYINQKLPMICKVSGRGSRITSEEFRFNTATAAQRAEAFLKTLNLS